MSKNYIGRACSICGETAVEGLGTAYCYDCLKPINLLNDAVREGPREVFVVWPHRPLERFLHAFLTGDHSLYRFEGIPKQTIPLDIRLGDPLFDGHAFECIKGFVSIYFVQREDGLIKIGRTHDLQQRFLTLQYPESVVLLGALEAVPFATENRLHKRFAEERVRGEWFRPSPRLLRYIRRFGRVDAPLSLIEAT